MKYSKYPSYKDSGVEWLGDVPENWTSIKFKQALMQKKKTTNNQLDCGSISFGTVVYKDNDKIPEETRDSYQEVLVGEFLINPLNLNFDLKSLRTALSTINVVVSTGYIVLQSKSNIEKNYLRWLLYQFDVAHMKTLGAGVRQTVNYTDIGNEYFHMPMISEQQAIANYLDIATDTIDTLISKQTKLIELLKEKRQAVISRAVTRGLDSKVAMKDSGVEWLGEIPEHWMTSPLKFLLSEPLMYGANESADRDNPSDPRYIRITDIKTDGTLHNDTFRSLPAKIAKPYLLKNDSLLLARSGATVGKTFLYNESWGVACFAGYLIKATILPSKANSKFISYFTNTTNYWQWLGSSQIQSTIENVSAEKYANLYIPMPPLQEQQAIANYLDKATDKIDTLISKATKAIDLLKEKRTALISSAVTGKIDVRKSV